MQKVRNRIKCLAMENSEYVLQMTLWTPFVISALSFLLCCARFATLAGIARPHPSTVITLLCHPRHPLLCYPHPPCVILGLDPRIYKRTGANSYVLLYRAKL